MKRAIALGTFDGVHIGHRAIINAAIDRAAKLDMEPMIYTFTAHPMALFGKQPPLLMTQSERMAALGGMGCMLSADEFSAEYAATEPEQFIKCLLSGSIWAAPLPDSIIRSAGAGKAAWSLSKAGQKIRLRGGNSAAGNV